MKSNKYPTFKLRYIKPSKMKGLENKYPEIDPVFESFRYFEKLNIT